MSELFEPADAYDRRLVLRGDDQLARLNKAGLIEAADVHVARRVGALAAESDDLALLALAMLVRAARLGSVCLSLSEPAELPEGPSITPDGWRAAVTNSALVRTGVICVEGDLFYLSRYWREEGAVVSDLLARRSGSVAAYDEARLQHALDELFVGETYSEQRQVAQASVRRLTSVITGGPGTGKTTTLARLLAALQASSLRPLRIALAAPTGKAAARMTQAIADSAAQPDFPVAYRDGLHDLSASTLHRLLGYRRESSTRFRHDRHNRLPHDVVVVDETSMVSITHMARLIESVRPDARLILVGDPHQLTSVEAGAVLQDLVSGFGPTVDSPVSELTRAFRFGDAIGRLSAAVREGDADAAWDLLCSGDEGVELIEPSDIEAISAAIEPPSLALLVAAESGDIGASLAALESHRLLCAHRDGPYGVGHWNRQIERWLLERTGREWFPYWYSGQPLIVNKNDHGLKLWNGDTGVVLRGGNAASGLHAVFADGTAAGRVLSLTRLAEVDTAHAMTVHRSQGSQFDQVTVLLPEPDSRTLTRELLYTALTRAQSKVRVITTEESLRAAVARPARRATGLAARITRALG